jgi:hypothetical protein
MIHVLQPSMSQEHIDAVVRAEDYDRGKPFPD